ncbi:hypothetical protein RU10_01840 [Pseudomonas fluorescens]|uniref:Uncharacterized protein n=1 Tax=Pseudomonas fluorescens TaxID=294 RepID=A0AAE2AZZ7_PSEFL|nr:hypothetical protein RU10_01840 [Pseudomonas fluorescens]
MSPLIQIVSKNCLAIFRPMIYLSFGIGPESDLVIEHIRSKRWALLPSVLHLTVVQILLVYLTYILARSPTLQPQKFVHIRGRLLA